MKHFLFSMCALFLSVFSFAEEGRIVCDPPKPDKLMGVCRKVDGPGPCLGKACVGDTVMGCRTDDYGRRCHPILVRKIDSNKEFVYGNFIDLGEMPGAGEGGPYELEQYSIKDVLFKTRCYRGICKGQHLVDRHKNEAIVYAVWEDGKLDLTDGWEEWLVAPAELEDFLSTVVATRSRASDKYVKFVRTIGEDEVAEATPEPSSHYHYVHIPKARTAR